MKQSVAFIIPAYNEATVIQGVIKDLIKSAKKESFNFEVVVIDDGSKDATLNEAKKGGATVIRHILNSGSGGATATGLSYAQQNDFFIAATLDADGQHKASDVINGVNLLLNNKSTADLLIGSRLIDSSGMSRVKILGNKGLSFITKLIFGVSVTDSQSGLRIYSRNALDNLKWKTSGFEFCSEMLWRADQLNLKIEEYPIEAIYSDYSKGKGQNNWNAFNIVKSLIKRRFVEVFGE